MTKNLAVSQRPVGSKRKIAIGVISLALVSLVLALYPQVQVAREYRTIELLSSGGGLHEQLLYGPGLYMEDPTEVRPSRYERLNSAFPGLVEELDTSGIFVKIQAEIDAIGDRNVDDLARAGLWREWSLRECERQRDKAWLPYTYYAVDAACTALESQAGYRDNRAEFIAMSIVHTRYLCRQLGVEGLTKQDSYLRGYAADLFGHPAAEGFRKAYERAASIVASHVTKKSCKVIGHEIGTYDPAEGAEVSEEALSSTGL